MKNSINSTISNNNEKIITPTEILFYPDKITAILTIKKDDIASYMKDDIAQKLWLSKKEEFHFTIIGSDTGKRILQSLEKVDEKDKQDIINKIKFLCQSYKRTFTLGSESYYIEKEYYESDSLNPETDVPETRKSIIQMIQLKNIYDFYHQLHTLVDIDFDVPLPHITLYTTSTIPEKKLRGIGIYSQEQFESLHPKTIV